ncbi:MAG: hypothetical protein ABSC76_12385 [Terracidiphilus sp.]|jgi:hypothetical protein
MTLQHRFVPLVLLWVFALPLLSQAGGAPASGDGNGTKRRDRQSAVHQSDGERKFAQNCGRCHTPPESFSPHISATIVRHMRVRASLSKQDEEDILRFLNP